MVPFRRSSVLFSGAIFAAIHRRKLFLAPSRDASHFISVFAPSIVHPKRGSCLRTFVLSNLAISDWNCRFLLRLQKHRQINGERKRPTKAAPFSRRILLYFIFDLLQFFKFR